MIWTMGDGRYPRLRRKKSDGSLRELHEKYGLND